MRVPETQHRERGIRPTVLNRENALFAGHDQGAENWACIVSLIELQTARLRSASLFRRRAQQARQSLARLASRRTHALGLRSRDAPNRAAKNQAVRAVRSKDRSPFLGVTPVPLIVAGQSAPAVASRSSRSRGVGGPAASLFEPADGSCLSLWRPAELLHFLQIGHPIVD
jgi:hypothetical protein